MMHPHSVASLIRDSHRATARKRFLLPLTSPSPRFQTRPASDLAIATVDQSDLEKPRSKALIPLRTIGKHASTLSLWQKDVVVLCRLIDEHPWNCRLEKALTNSSSPLVPDIAVAVIRALPEAKQALRFFIWISEQHGFLQSPKIIGAISRRWSHENRSEGFLASVAAWRTNTRLMTSDSYLLLITGYGWAGMMEKAAAILFSMEEHGCIPVDKHFNCLLAALAKEEYFSLMPPVYQRMLNAGFSPDSDSFTAVIRGLCNISKGPEALEVLNLMKSKGLAPDEPIYAMVVDVLCKSQRFLDALCVVREMVKNGWRVAIRTCNNLANGLCKQGKLDEAYEPLYEIVQKGSVPNLVTLTAVFKHLCEGGQIDKAFKLWKKINKKRVPTVTFHDTLVDSLCKAGKYSEAEQIFTELKATGSAVSRTIYSSLIQCYCATDKLEKGCKILHDMAENYRTCDAGVYNLVLQGLYKAGRIGEAMKVIRKVGSKYFDSKSSTFQSLVVDLCKADDMDKAFILLDLTKKAGHPMDNATCNILVCMLGKAGKLEEALMLLEKITEEGNIIDVSTYDTLAEAFQKVKAEREAKARSLLNELEICEPAQIIS